MLSTFFTFLAKCREHSRDQVAKTIVLFAPAKLNRIQVVV